MRSRDRAWRENHGEKIIAVVGSQTYTDINSPLHTWEGDTMRFLFKMSFPVEAGNAAAKDGFKATQKILEAQKPEAVYFAAQGGNRSGIMIINMDDPSEIPVIAEPWFLAFNASIEITPVMTPEDLAKAGPSIEQAVTTYG